MTSNMIGQNLGSFRITSQLGAGAMGVVYKATHDKSGKTAALKVITADQTARGNATERFEREAEILKNLKHPNIVRWLGVGRFKGTDYFAMEFIEGRTLEDLLDERLQKDQESLGWREVVDLGVQICEALQYAHERNVVHRDLKPSNIMVTNDHQVKLTDFGIAKLLDADATKLTATGRTLGTAAYMAPEQIRGTPEVSHKTDLYALGCLFYQMLTGQTPFQGGQLAVLMNCHLTQEPPRPSAKSADLPLELDRLIVQMMAKEPRDRPLDAEMVAERLREIQSKIKSGAPIRMVFGGEFRTQVQGMQTSVPQTNPTRLGFAAPLPSDTVALGDNPPGRSVTASKATRKKKKKPAESSWSAPSASTIGLLLALISLMVVTGWLLRPLSAEQLYERARPLMESQEPADWKDADRRYLSELESRFPNNPYQAEIDKLRDKVALNDTRARARRISRGLLEPKSDVESLYQRVEITATEAEKSGNGDLALRAWNELARALATEFPKERGWLLLARENARTIQEVLERNVANAHSLIAQIKSAEANGQDEMARGLHERLREELREHPYLTRLISSHLLPREPGVADSSSAGSLSPPQGAPGSEDSGTP